MRDDNEPKVSMIVSALETGAGAKVNFGTHPAQSAPPKRRERVFWVLWHICTILLIVSIFMLAYSSAWEFSTRRYLTGFSDAIIPAESTPTEKIEAILDWMSRGPKRQVGGPITTAPVRNPTETLNYGYLLNVCGTATNAFINLANSSQLSARRLLLLDSNRSTKHVVAEVWVNGRWIVVDPVFRYIPRGPDGSLLTSTQLADPAIFTEATRNVPNYNPAYNFQLTAHVHLARIPYIGGALRRMLDTLIPGWSDSPVISLLLERNSLALLVVSMALVVFAAIWRLSLRWYAAAKLNMRPPHLTARLARACTSFFGASA